MDSDQAGKEAENEIVRRLGNERIRLVQLPYKDANECLKHNIIDFRYYLRSARSLDPSELKPADYFTDQVIDKFYPSEGSYRGMRTPWKKVNEALKFDRAELIIWTGFSGSGKALAIDTKIPTAFGWKTMGEMAVGDFVYDEKGDVCKVIAVTDVMMDRPCYKVTFSDGCEIVADANHEWLTDTIQSRQSKYHAKKNNRHIDRPIKKHGNDQSHKRRISEIVTTEMIANTLVAYRGKDKIEVCVNHSIDVAGPLNLPYRQLPIDPYILGLWLGDGDTNGQGFTTGDQEVLDAFVKAGFEVTNRSAKYHYGILGFMNVLKENGFIGNKHIPDDYMRASYFQRLALLQGLMDSDGYVDQSKCEFCSTNKEIAYKVLELTRTLGIRSYMVLGRAMLYGKDCGEKYRVMFTTNLPVFRLERQLAKLKDSVSVITTRRYIVACDSFPSVPVRCIQVSSPSHLYLAGESMIPTHNSLILNQVAAQGMLDNEKFVICSMEMPGKVTLWRMNRQLTGQEKPSRERIQQTMKWMSDKLWIVDIIGTGKVDRILEVFKYAVKRYDIRNFIIDSLTKCGIAEEDYNGQKEFIDKLTDFAHHYQVIIHLVVHQRKPMTEDGRPGKFGVRGAAAINYEAKKESS